MEHTLNSNGMACILMNHLDELHQDLMVLNVKQPVMAVRWALVRIIRVVRRELVAMNVTGKHSHRQQKVLDVRFRLRQLMHILIPLLDVSLNRFKARLIFIHLAW